MAGVKGDGGWGAISRPILMCLGLVLGVGGWGSRIVICREGGIRNNKVSTGTQITDAKIDMASEPITVTPYVYQHKGHALWM